MLSIKRKLYHILRIKLYFIVSLLIFLSHCTREDVVEKRILTEDEFKKLSEDSTKIYFNYGWRYYNGKEYRINFSISKKALAKSKQEYGIKKGREKPKIPEYKYSIKYETKEELRKKLKMKKQEIQQKREKIIRDWTKNLNDKCIKVVWESKNEYNRSPDYKKIYELNEGRLEKVRKKFRNLIQNNSLSNVKLYDIILSFVQKIKYKIPDTYRDDILIIGLLLPLEVLANNYGDCDSKSLLLATLWGDNFNEKVILLDGPNHMIVGIEGVPRPGQSYFKISNNNYIICETTSSWPPGIVPKEVRLDFQQGKYDYIELN